MIENQIIINFAAVDWDFIWQRHQQLMSRFAEKNKVIYIEPSYSLLALRKKREFRKFIRSFKGVTDINENLKIVTLPPLVPFENNFYWVRKINFLITKRLIKKLVKNISAQPPILWLTFPWFLDFIGQFDEKLVCYDCVDDHVALAAPSGREKVRKLEEKVFQKADLVFATAQTLFKRASDFNPNSYLVPNAADFAHFYGVLKERNDTPQELKDIKHPIMGFYGGICDWVDLELIEGIAKLHSEWSFVFIGVKAVDLSKFNRANLYFMNSIPYDRLPHYAKYFDVCLVPFKLVKRIESVNSIKIYEYLSLGRPVVSTGFLEAKKIGELDLIYIAKDAAEFECFLKTALEEKGNIQERRIEFAKANSWDARVEEISKIMAQKLKGSDRRSIIR
jgi:glycosyltransferase involved in cell wall biosynthesis